MQSPLNRPEAIADETLTDVTGGAEYLAPGVYVEEVSFSTTNRTARTATIAASRSVTVRD